MICIIKGEWKTGKTNVGLRIIEDLIHWGIIKVAGTNIKIEPIENVNYIDNFQDLKQFHYDDPINPKHKCFALDEAGKHVVRRGAMRRENVEWMKFLPELSKGRCKLLVITQLERLTDSIFTETEFTRAMITARKHETYGYSISVQSELIPRPYFFYVDKFPKTNIKYSAYSSADWFLERREDNREELFCCKVARLYALDGKNTTKIANELGLKTRTNVLHILKRHIRHTLHQLTKADIEVLRHELKTGEILPYIDEKNLIQEQVNPSVNV